MSAIVSWVSKVTTERDWKRLGLAYGTVVIALIVGHQLLRSSIVEKVYPEAQAVKKIKLMEHEKELMMMMPGVTTLTTYKAKRIPETFLKRKLAELIRKNPWLCGRIHKSANDGLHVTYPESIDGAEAVSKRIKEHLHVVIDFELPENISYDETIKLVDHLQVKKGNSCIDKPYGLLFRVSLLKIKGRDEVALVVSMSHVLGDGHTYYRVLSMLDNSTPVTALNPVRSDHYEAEVSKLIDPNTAKWFANPCLMAGLIGCSLFRTEMKTLVVRVDNEWILKQKLAHAESQKSLQDGSDSSFISTNDILTAWHNRICGCTIALMSVNARNRAPAFTDQMAGNYQTSIVYNTPEDCHTPEAIRESLRTYHSASGSHPGLLKTLEWNAAIATNWCTFYKQVDISDVGNKAPCAYLRHLPIAGTADMAVWREAAVFFKIDAATTGILLMTRAITARMVEATGVGKVCKTL